MTISGDYAYVANVAGGVTILNVSQPAAITLQGTRLTATPVYEVRVSGNSAYLAAGVGGLQVVDVTQTSALGMLTTGLSGARRVKYVGSHAYVVNDGSADPAQQGLYVLDVTDPAAPLTQSFVITASGATGVDVVGNTAYVTRRHIHAGLRHFRPPRLRPCWAASISAPGRLRPTMSRFPAATPSWPVIAA